MFLKRLLSSPHHGKASFTPTLNGSTIYRQFTTPAQNTQFQTRNLLLSKQKPTKTQDYKLINPQLEVYKRESSRMLKEYYRKYAAGRDKRVEAGKERRKRREVRDEKWNAYEQWMERSLNPLQCMTAEQKKVWEREREKIEARRVRKGERGRLRLYLHTTPIVQKRQKTIAHLLQMAESGHQFITTMEQAEKAIKHALANPTNYNITWERLVEDEDKLREELSKQPCLRRPVPKIDTKLFPRGLKDILPDSRKRKQILPSRE
jgi:hypothetical protein